MQLGKASNKISLIFTNFILIKSMKYYCHKVGRGGCYYTTEKNTEPRKYGGRKSKEEKKILIELSRLKIKKGKFIVSFD